MQSSAPALVIVSGAPASGKSSLARRLAHDLRLPLLSKDELKECLADALGAPADVAGSTRLGTAAHGFLYRVAEALLAAGCRVIVESNFRRGLSEPELRGLHAAHLDADRAAALADDIDAGRFGPLELGLPVVRAELTDAWHPPYEDIRDAVAHPGRRS